MDVAGAVLFKELVVKPGAITLVQVEAVLGVCLVVFVHKAVASDFGDDGGSGDTTELRVAFDY